MNIQKKGLLFNILVETGFFDEYKNERNGINLK